MPGPLAREGAGCLKPQLCFAGRHNRYDRTHGPHPESARRDPLMSDERLLFDRKLLRARRARFAPEIEAHEFLLAHVAREIAERVELMLRPFPLALDLGAYHGLLGRSVAELPSVGAMIYAESVFEFAALCPRPSLVCDEDLLPFKAPSFNLIVSGLALHRVNDLPGALIQIRRALHPDGLFMAALLGARALSELRQALLEAEAEIEGGASPRVAPFGDVREYGALLQRAGFALPVADAETLTVLYASPRELMREVRALGGGNVLLARSRAPLSRKTLERAEAIYRERHASPDGRVSASFEIVYLSGWGPDASQQQPLKPGSAAQRLADALGTTEQPAGDKAAFPRQAKALAESALQHLEHAADRAADLADHRHDGDGDEGQDPVFDGRGAGAVGSEAPGGDRKAHRQPGRLPSKVCGPWSSPNSQQIAKSDLERLVGRRHVVEVQRVGLHPEKLLAFMRGHVSPPAAAEIDRHQQVEIGISVARESERRQIALLDLDAKLLVQLADQGFLRLLSRLDLASGKLPQAGERSPWRAFGDQHGALLIEQCAGRDDNDRALRALAHTGIRRLMQFCLNTRLRTGSRH